MAGTVIYLDTSVIVPLFLPEPRSRESEAQLMGKEVIVSDLGLGEFSSAIALAVRIGRIEKPTARTLLIEFDDWVADHAFIAHMQSDDFTAATAYIRRFDLALRTPDALHIAVAGRLGATLFTFDAKMAAAATALGVAVA
jgi:uncharacterized protein